MFVLFVDYTNKDYTKTYTKHTHNIHSKNSVVVVF
jgi:hypothetical protein